MKIKKALLKAYEAHNDCFRKSSNIPYFVHILDVAKYLMYETDDEDVICAGILHDTLEDSNYTKEELLNDFGEKVYNLVLFCTEPENTPFKTVKQQKESWKRRKQHSIDNIKNASYEQLLVYTCDKLANLVSIKEDIICKVDVWSKFNASKKEQEWYYRSILKEIKSKLEGRRIFAVYEDLVDDVFND